MPKSKKVPEQEATPVAPLVLQPPADLLTHVGAPGCGLAWHRPRKPLGELQELSLFLTLCVTLLNKYINIV